MRKMHCTGARARAKKGKKMEGNSFGISFRHMSMNLPPVKWCSPRPPWRIYALSLLIRLTAASGTLFRRFKCLLQRNGLLLAAIICLTAKTTSCRSSGSREYRKQCWWMLRRGPLSCSSPMALSRVQRVHSRVAKNVILLASVFFVDDRVRAIIRGI